MSLSSLGGGTASLELEAIEAGAGDVERFREWFRLKAAATNAGYLMATARVSRWRAIRVRR
jgi:hypothetical protein